MGASNLRRGLSSLQTELEALVWARQSMFQHNKRTMYFETDCSNVVKMVGFLDFIGRDRQMQKKKFFFCSIMHISRTNNTKTDKLAQSA
uniref:RNase H type-1 domain-containing protein n=1 Tax=Noccaea caerulescens TaxID=107243 RepID=A0A1J3K6H0_NOCCA